MGSGPEARVDDVDIGVDVAFYLRYRGPRTIADGHHSWLRATESKRRPTRLCGTKQRVPPIAGHEIALPLNWSVHSRTCVGIFRRCTVMRSSCDYCRVDSEVYTISKLQSRFTPDAMIEESR